MACGATSNLDYPDYIKSMLKVINVGNDNDLKACACSLKTPLTSEGCPVTDEDGKVGVFRYCIENGVGFWSLKKAMDLYWRVKSWELKNVSLTYSIVVNGVPTQFTTQPEADFLPLVRRYNETGSPEDGGAPLTSKEQLVCHHPYASTGAYAGSVDEPFAYVGCAGATTDGTLYTPGFQFYATFKAFIRPDLDPDRYDFEIFSVGQSGGQESFSIYGAPISFGVFPLNAADGEYTFVRATLSLEPTSWWA